MAPMLLPALGPLLMLILLCSTDASSPLTYRDRSPASGSKWMGPAEGPCALPDGIITTRRQLRTCGFETIVVVTSPPPYKAQHAGQSNEPLPPIPFPLVVCAPLPATHNDSDVVSFLRFGEDDEPPCVRPSIGRDDVAIAAFLAQNYESLPAHMFFIHGHEVSHHQDSPMSSILSEFTGRPLLNDAYLSLNNFISQDWRTIRCFLWLCNSAGLQRMLNKGYKQYFEEWLGPMPGNMQHFCCAQFLVARDRVLARPRGLYEATLRWTLGVLPPGTLPGKCFGSCEDSSQVMEVMWAHIFSEALPFQKHDARMLNYTWPVEEFMPSSVLQDYRRLRSTPEPVLLVDAVADLAADLAAAASAAAGVTVGRPRGLQRD